MAQDRFLPPPPAATGRQASPAGPAHAQAMAGSFWGDGGEAPADARSGSAPGDSTEAAPPRGASGKAPPATETIGRRAGALSDELNFPDFVASLIHGTWDAMVDSTIRQMDSVADLVAAVSKPLAQFRDENVTANQARDWLVSNYPGDVTLAQGEAGLVVVPRKAKGSEDGSGTSPGWLSDFGLGGQDLSGELLEEQLVPAARDRLASDRMQTLATLVMLGMNRVVVKDGSITARLRFRAAAADKTSVDYAVSDDPGHSTPTGSWSTRGSTAYQPSVTKVSTVGVNAQTDSSLNAEMFGEVKINFASETLPLDRFVDDARRTLLERAARPMPAVAAPNLPPPVPAAAPAPVTADPQPGVAAAPRPGAPT